MRRIAIAKFRCATGQEPQEGGSSDPCGPPALDVGRSVSVKRARAGRPANGSADASGGGGASFGPELPSPAVSQAQSQPGGTNSGRRGSLAPDAGPSVSLSSQEQAGRRTDRPASPLGRTLPRPGIAKFRCATGQEPQEGGSSGPRGPLVPDVEPSVTSSAPEQAGRRTDRPASPPGRALSRPGIAHPGKLRADASARRRDARG